MAEAHITRNGFYDHSVEADYIEGEGTFTPLPEYDPETEALQFTGVGWSVVPVAVRDAYQPPEPPPPPIPMEVSAVQAKTALFAAGLYDAVETALGGSPYALIRIWWDSAQVWRRDNPYISALATELGLSDDQVDGLFVAAAAVQT
jgi:hypothetical protein